jgi:uncharacterized protein (TIGR02284 family)
MKTTHASAIGTLNDLVKINNDRIEGYQKAVELTSDADSDLREIFNGMADESRQYANELTNYMNRLGEEAEEGTRTDGKIYRVWMGIKAAFSGKDRKSILASCERGEDAAQKAYEEALNDEDLSVSERELVMDQKSRLRVSHDKIKRLRDMQQS